MLKNKHILLFMLLLITGGSLWAAPVDGYPAQCRVTAHLNVRKTPSKNAAKIGLLPKGEQIIVLRTTGTDSDLWGAIDYGGKRGYVSMRYVTYISPIKHQSQSLGKKHWKSVVRFFSDLWGVINWLWLALVPTLVVVLVLLRFKLGYYILSFPFYWLNQLEHFLVEPWRYLFRNDWVTDNFKPTLRILLEVISALLYILITPLRLFNAVVYNLIIHNLANLYDLLFEVIKPCDSREGAGDFWRWTGLLLWRLLKYPIFHGSLTVVESVLWTVIDIFIPARTLYHGTDLAACEAITRDPHRNRYLKRTSNWTTGTFLASTHPNCTWAGRGVYFAINRSLSLGYSDRAGDTGNDPVLIACRVSIGRVINYTLTPSSVYRQAGSGGNHSELNKFGVKHHYTTGEWYNNRKHWEYCLFDWQNRYNHPWRIRPIYVLNARTFRAQHIRGGVQHWLFDKAVWEDIFSRG